MRYESEETGRLLTWKQLRRMGNTNYVGKGCGADMASTADGGEVVDRGEGGPRTRKDKKWIKWI